MSRKIVIIDDSDNYRENLKKYLSDDGEVLAFRYPYDFSDRFKEPEDVADIDLIVLDYKFDSSNSEKQGLLGYIRNELKYEGLTVLWSLESDIPAHYRDRFDAVFPKELFTFSEVEECARS